MMFFAAILALVYASVFLAMGAWRPRYALALIFALAPFNRDISLGGPFRFSLTEVNLFLALPLLLVRPRQITFGPTLLPATAFFLSCVLSSFVDLRTSAAATLLQTGLYLIVAVTVFASLARTEEDYRPALKGYVIVSTLLAAVACVLRSGYVFGMHKNAVGASLSVGFLIALELSLSARKTAQRWSYGVALFFIAAAELISLSRGAWLSSIFGTVVIFLLRRQFRLLLRAAVVLVPMGLVVWQLLPAEQKEYAFGMSSDRENIRLRLESIHYAVRQFEEHPLLGAGTGLRKDYDATNVILLTLAETGLLGLLTFAALHAITAGAIWMGHRGLPKNSFSFSVVVIAGALVFGKLAHGLVDHYWSRGALSATWAAMGMAAGTIKMNRRRYRGAGRARRIPVTPQLVRESRGASPASVPPSRCSVSPL